MKSFLTGFTFAFKGICIALREERNFRFHCCAAVYVLLFSLFYDFTQTQYLFLLLIIAGVLTTELLNSAIEKMVDGLMPGHNVCAGAVKDLAAGAVLVFCIGAAVCGVFLFWDLAVFAQIAAYFKAHLGMLLLFLASLAASYWFIYCTGMKNQDSKGAL